MQFLLELKSRNEILFFLGLTFLIGSGITFLVSLNSSIQVAGVNAWYKPTKFLLSSVIFLWTMNWYLGYLPYTDGVKWYSWTMVLFFLFENIYIAYQASRGELSHFNLSSPIKSLMFSFMGLAATGISIATLVIGLKFFQSPATFPDISIGYLWGIRLGIILFFLFSLEGLAMGSRLSHTVGAPDGSEGIPFLNWSKQYGDLRVAHFVGMHALQVVPLISYLLFARSVTGAVVTALIYGSLSLWAFIKALR